MKSTFSSLSPGDLSSVFPFPVDTTRVILHDVDDSVPGANCINANYVRVRVQAGVCGRLHASPGMDQTGRLEPCLATHPSPYPPVMNLELLLAAQEDPGAPMIHGPWQDSRRSWGRGAVVVSKESSERAGLNMGPQLLPSLGQEGLCEPPGAALHIICVDLHCPLSLQILETVDTWPPPPYRVIQRRSQVMDGARCTSPPRAVCKPQQLPSGQWCTRRTHESLSWPQGRWSEAR